MPSPLPGVEALIFDVFGTVVDWHGTVTRVVAEHAKALGHAADEDWSAFAMEWRAGYYKMTREIAAGKEGPGNVDTMHRQILDGMLASERWSSLASVFTDAERAKLNMVWHRLDGWPDSSEGLHLLKKQFVIGTLSNGNVRLLVDMAKNADLPWDVIFSGELLGSYKPNPKMYMGAAHHLSVPPEKVVMVAAHINDLQHAASHGLKTAYVRRPTEDDGSVGGNPGATGVKLRDTVKSKEEGGEVDVVVDSFVQLAQVLKG